MVVGVGIDIVSPKKVEEAIERWGQDFIERVFNPEEVNPIQKGKVYYQRLAARFAAKEAVVKSLSKNYSLALKDILITNLPNGAPVCTFKKNVDLNVFISISHIEEYAVATAIAQKKNKE
ncbi:MAG: holo-ACP synthase [Candidatus Omnitrophica bacterium]|nr:holo-ACP synthase [Candidatus Omnitrophota bacterium]